MKLRTIRQGKCQESVDYLAGYIESNFTLSNEGITTNEDNEITIIIEIDFDHNDSINGIRALLQVFSGLEHADKKFIRIVSCASDLLVKRSIDND